MNIFNDIIILNMYIPKLVILGIFCFFIIQLSLYITIKFHLLKYFWHPRLVIWSYSIAIYSVLIIFTILL